MLSSRPSSSRPSSHGPLNGRSMTHASQTGGQEPTDLEHSDCGHVDAINTLSEQLLTSGAAASASTATVRRQQHLPTAVMQRTACSTATVIKSATLDGEQYRRKMSQMVQSSDDVSIPSRAVLMQRPVIRNGSKWRRPRWRRRRKRTRTLAKR